MKDLQFRSASSYLVPKEVYQQCVWMIRDSERLYQLALDVEVAAEVSSAARNRIEAIDEALNTIPEEYRYGLIKHVKNRLPYEDFAHENTWKKWQRRFVYELAINLMLI